MKSGKRIVYQKSGQGFEQREVKILCENESRAAVEGLGPDEKVALLDPTAPKKAGTESMAGCRGDTLMATTVASGGPRVYGVQQWLPDLQLGLQNLLLHRLRSLLTMLGMILEWRRWSPCFQSERALAKR